jgi:DNA-binding IscR family transcriptional regulator
MKEVRDAIAGILETMTVADLVKRADELQKQPDSVADYVI